MLISSIEYCKKCRKNTSHSTTLNPDDKLTCDTCGTVWTRSKDYYKFGGRKKGSGK